MTLEDRETPPGEHPTPRRWRRPIALAVVLVLAGSATALFAFGLSRDPTLIRSVLVGKQAPDFTLPTLDGGPPIRLSDLRGQVVVVNFWASWCAACRQEHPNFVAAWSRYRDRGVVFLGIVFQDTPKAAMDYMKQAGGDWPILADPGSATAQRYGVYGVPETFFIDGAGRVAYKQVGYTSYEQLTGRVDALLAEGGAGP